MVVSKLNLLIIASIAGAVVWIEHGNHLSLRTSAPAEVGAPAAPVCPENESVPHSADCFAFQGDAASDVRERLNTVPNTRTSDAPRRAVSAGPACPPNNENVPYSASCLRFLSGPDWQANPADNAP
jgi:hypothetical protein